MDRAHLSVRRLALFGGACCSAVAWGAAPGEGLASAGPIHPAAAAVGGFSVKGSASARDGDAEPVIVPVLRMSTTFGAKPPKSRAFARPPPSPLSLLLDPLLRLSRPRTPEQIERAARGKPTLPAGRAEEPRESILGNTGSSRSGNDGDPDEPAPPVAFDPSPAMAGGLPSRTNVQKQVEAELPALGDNIWRIAPVRYMGSSTSSVNSLSYADQSKSLGISNALNLSASSYVVAPYIAQWTGSLGYTSAQATNTPSSGPVTRSNTGNLTYSAYANVLPNSRFASAFNISQGFSQSRSGEFSQPSRTTSFGARQQYQTEDGADNYTASFNRTSSSSVSSGTNDANSIVNTSAVSMLSGRYMTRRKFDYEHLLEGDHTLVADMGLTSELGNFSADQSRRVSGNVTHNWAVHEDLQLNSTVTFARGQMTSTQGTLQNSSNSTVFLGSTGFSWRPIEDVPFTLNGIGGFSATQISNGGQLLNRQQSINGSVAGTYRFSPNLSASGNASLAATTSESQRILSNMVGGFVSYTGDPLGFSGFNYGWNVNGNASLSANSVAGSAYSTGIAASHSLSRAILFSGANHLNLNANQNLSLTQGREGAGTALSNSLGASWSARYDEHLSGTLSANLADSISRTVLSSNHARSATLNGIGQYQISSRAGISAQTAFNWSQNANRDSGPQSINGISTDPSAPQVTGSFTLNYAHRSPFSIPRLSYNANLIKISSFSNQRLDVFSQSQGSSQESLSLQHLLDYRLGKLLFRLNFTTISQGGTKSASMFGSIQRDIDGVFSGIW